MSITNTSAIHYQASATAFAAKSTKKTDSSDSFRNLVQESVVDEFKRKNPDRASHVVKRHKRMKKLLKEQVEQSLQRDMAQKTAAREEYARQQYESSMRQHSFLTTGSPDSKEVPTAGSPAAAMTAAAAYVMQ